MYRPYRRLRPDDGAQLRVLCSGVRSLRRGLREVRERHHAPVRQRSPADADCGGLTHGFSVGYGCRFKTGWHRCLYGAALNALSVDGSAYQVGAWTPTTKEPAAFESRLASSVSGSEPLLAVAPGHVADRAERRTGRVPTEKRGSAPGIERRQRSRRLPGGGRMVLPLGEDLVRAARPRRDLRRQFVRRGPPRCPAAAPFADQRDGSGAAFRHGRKRGSSSCANWATSRPFPSWRCPCSCCAGNGGPALRGRHSTSSPWRLSGSWQRRSTSSSARNGDTWPPGGPPVTPPPSSSGRWRP